MCRMLSDVGVSCSSCERIKRSKINMVVIVEMNMTVAMYDATESSTSSAGPVADNRNHQDLV